MYLGRRGSRAESQAAPCVGTPTGPGPSTTDSESSELAIMIRWSVNCALAWLCQPEPRIDSLGLRLGLELEVDRLRSGGPSPAPPQPGAPVHKFKIWLPDHASAARLSPGIMMPLAAVSSSPAWLSLGLGGLSPCQAQARRDTSALGRRFAAALLPRLFGKNPRSHHKGATGRVRTGNQRLPGLCHYQLGQDIPLHNAVPTRSPARARLGPGWAPAFKLLDGSPSLGRGWVLWRDSFRDSGWPWAGPGPP